MPAELQQQIIAIVDQTRRRSGWAVRRTLRSLGVSVASYYRWWAASRRALEGLGGPPPPVQPYEALPEERQAVRDYALKHPELRHRELAWRMVDEDVAYLSPSTVYRILRAARLVCPWQRRSKRRRQEQEKAQGPDERWATDLKYVQVGERNYYLITFLDEYSRYIVYHELLTSMDGHSVSVAAQAALEKLAGDGSGALPAQPEIRSDNGSGYISREFAGVLDERGLKHRRIRPHCPEENGLVERAQRTIGEALEDEEMGDYFEAVRTIERVVQWYNTERLHSALGWLRPVDYYRGDPKSLHEERRRKLAQARHERKERNLEIRQRTLALEALEPGGAVA